MFEATMDWPRRLGENGHGIGVRFNVVAFARLRAAADDDAIKSVGNNVCLRTIAIEKFIRLESETAGGGPRVIGVRVRALGDFSE